MKQAAQWTRWAERIVATGERPHFAPEPETLDVHVRELCRLSALLDRPPQTLILGATPELADLALERGCAVTRLDCNPAMFGAAARRQRDVDRTRERIVVGDWLEMPQIEPGSIDLVLGDAALNNVPHDRMSLVMTQLERVTRSGSVLSLRQLALPAAVTQMHPLERTVKRLRTGDIHLPAFRRLLRYACFVDEVYDVEHCLLDASRVYECIDRSHRDGRLSDDEHAFMNSRRSALQHTLYLESEQQRWFEKLGRCRVERAGEPSDHEFVTNVWVTERT